MLPPPNPLLRKTLKVYEKPPESSVKGIVFKKLKEFKQFQNQPQDQLANTIKIIKHDRSRSDASSPIKDKNSSLIGPV